MNVRLWAGLGLVAAIALPVVAQLPAGESEPVSEGACATEQSANTAECVAEGNIAADPAVEPLETTNSEADTNYAEAPVPSEAEANALNAAANAVKDEPEK